MQITINLYNLKINNISGNGSITIGEAIHNSHTSKIKSHGANSSYGDASNNQPLMENIYIDPDVNDQTDIGNADSVNLGFPTL
jgi:hypothetical protein